MLKKYEWIEADKAFFGKPNGIYDFEQYDPKEIASKLPALQERKAKLSRAVNTRAVNLLGKEEEQVGLLRIYSNYCLTQFVHILNQFTSIFYLCSSKNC